DVLSRAEFEIKSASQPRYHLEMALLRWIHLRKLVSIEDLIAGNSVASGFSRTAPAAPKVMAPSVAEPAAAAAAPPVKIAPAAAQSAPAGKPAGDSSFKDAFLAEIRKNKVAFYSRS